MVKNATVNDKELSFDWNLDGEGVLTVRGTGRMPDLGGNNHAQSLWQDIKESVRKVQIGEGITEIGMRDFEGCANLTEVHFPSSLKRIRAYAFRGCTSLEKVEAEGREFRYIYEESLKEERSEEKTVDESLVFGIGSFAGTPWAEQYFGRFYVREGVLYCCFSEQEPIRIPEGVVTIAKFAFKNIHGQELIMPSSLERIEKYAFAGAEFAKIVMPHSQEYLMKEKTDPAFWDCAGIKSSRKRIKVPFLYELALRETKYGEYKRFAVRRKNAKTGEDGVKRLWGRELVDVGGSLLRRMKKGAVVIGIQFDKDHRIMCVKSFVWLEQYGVADEYLMYPCVEEKNEIGIWRDSFTYIEELDIDSGFGDMNAKKLMEEDAIRFTAEDYAEEWFWSADRGNYGGPLELELLEKWMKSHPGFTVDTMEENQEKDGYRIFVEV